VSYEAIRDSIVARLNTVADIGVVNDYRRGVVTYSDFASRFTTTIGGVQQIRGWDVAWESSAFDPDTWLNDGTMRLAGQQIYVVRGYMGVNDAAATDKTFSSLIRLVLRALASCKATLAPKEARVPVMLRSNAFLNFEVPGLGTTLVQHCEIVVRVRDEEVV